MAESLVKARLRQALREYVELDLRLSHLMVAGAIIVGALINLRFAHGWTIWPAVLAFGILTHINEAVARNGEGIPPVQVYAFFFGAVAVWFVLILLLFALNPLILFVGLAAIIYRVVEAIIGQRERDRLIATRRAQGLCLHCGEVYDPNSVFCESCGEEPNTDEARLKRTAQICRSAGDVERARSVLGKKAPATSTSAKEQALLARHRSGKTTHQSPLPKAAKLGASSSKRG